LDTYIGVPKYERLIKDKLQKINAMEKQRESVLELNPLKIFADKSSEENGKE